MTNLLTILLLPLSLFLSIQPLIHALATCNTLDPQCGLTATAAQQQFLTPHADLLNALQRIQRQSQVPVTVGPLIKNGDNGGLLDIDIPLDLSLAPSVKTDVCGAVNPTPTIRQAVVCTVTRDDVLQPPRGNVRLGNVGVSTQGRVLYALRMGNPNGRRVFIVTQQHGNEAASTEGALSFLRKFTRRGRASNRILRQLNLLFLIRANPDGSEPSANNTPDFGVPFDEAQGFFRQNVDPTAGGAFEVPTEPNFFGVVGRGYDLNRYNYAGLDFAIRPVESQAMVAALHAFRPEVLFDMHGDQPKALCELDARTFRPAMAAGQLPSITCKSPTQSVPTLLTQRSSSVLGGFFAEDARVLTGAGTDGLKSGARFRANTRLIRSLVAEVIFAVSGSVEGVFTRFNQIDLGAAAQTDGALDRAALALGAVGSGWEVTMFETALRPAVGNVRNENGELQSDVGFDTGLVEPCFVRDSICLHSLLLRRTLSATVKLIGRRLLGDNGYCTIPLNNGLVVSLPASAGWGDMSIEEPILIPQGGEFDVPVTISGECAGDV